nr:exosortase H [uncultured Roseateles sp.]
MLASADPRPGTSVVRFLLTFSLLALAGFGLEITLWVDDHVIKPLTGGIAWLAGQSIQWAGGSAKVAGRVIQHPDGFAISISNGCSGLEAVILLAAAILAFPASWAARLRGLLLGTVAIMALNLLRVISLYYIGQYSRAWFDWAHLYAWDILIMLDGLIVFLLWIRQLPAPGRHAPA